MDTIRTKIADKVLEISTSDSSEIKIKLEKINRFRDFTDACQILIQKYPEIENEFLRMIENDDFDARVAASRVDTIIRLSEINAPQINKETETSNFEEDINQLDEIIECIPNQEITTAPNNVENINKPDNKTKETPLIEKNDVKNLIEETKGEVINLNEEYVDFEEIIGSEDSLFHVTNLETAIETEPSRVIQEIESKKEIEKIPNTKKENIKKGLLILGIIAAIIILIFIVTFIINNWQLVLWILGGCVVATGVVWLLLKRNKDK